MSSFPRTNIGGLSVSRMVIGTNWFLGYSHCTPSKDRLIKEIAGGRKAIASVMEVFFNAGVDTLMAPITMEPLIDAVKDAEDRTGVKAILIATPHFPFNSDTPVNGFDADEVEQIVETNAKLGASICMPHGCTTDAMVDRCTRRMRKMDQLCKAIREHGMIPGLSTHMPESIVYSDESGLDVETYISVYNSMGFLMPLEVDWISNIIHNAKKPVLAIKPMAAGQIRPFQALNFVWNTLRPIDAVVAGTMTPDEAKELIDMSLSILENKINSIKLQETRSKASVKTSKN